MEATILKTTYHASNGTTYYIVTDEIGNEFLGVDKRYIKNGKTIRPLRRAEVFGSSTISEVIDKIEKDIYKDLLIKQGYGLIEAVAIAHGIPEEEARKMQCIYNENIVGA